MTTILLAMGWTFLAVGLSIDGLCLLTRPFSMWWGPMTTIFTAYIWGPCLLAGYGSRLVAWWWSRGDE